jgi:hypothetical protein
VFRRYWRNWANLGHQPQQLCSSSNQFKHASRSRVDTGGQALPSVWCTEFTRPVWASKKCEDS